MVLRFAAARDSQAVAHGRTTCQTKLSSAVTQHKSGCLGGHLTLWDPRLERWEIGEGGRRAGRLGEGVGEGNA